MESSPLDELDSPVPGLFAEAAGAAVSYDASALGVVQVAAPSTATVCVAIAAVVLAAVFGVVAWRRIKLWRRCTPGPTSARGLGAGPGGEQSPSVDGAYGRTRERFGAREQQRLRDYGRFLRSVIDGLPSQVCILDASARIIETNRAWDRFVDAAGLADEGAAGSSFVQFCRTSQLYLSPRGDRVKTAALAIAAGDEHNFRNRFTTRLRGCTRTIDIHLVPLDGADRGRVMVVQDDRTDEHEGQRQLRFEKEKAEKLAGALVTSQTSLELAVRGGNLGLWHWDIDSDYFELTPDWIAEFGHEAAEFGADVQHFRELLHPDDAAVWTAEDAHGLAQDEPYDRHFRLRRADGGYVWVHALGRANAVKADGSPASLAGVMIDIDVRKQAELRVAGLAKIVEESLNEVFVVDRETDRFIEVNRGARENLGYSMDELLGMRITDVEDGQHESGWRERVGPLLNGEVERLEFESVNRRRDGSAYPILLVLQCSRLMGRDVLVGIGVDLTLRRDLEEQLQSSRRLESIGQLAAGVAHEMNTPLQYVSNNIRFLSDCSERLFQSLAVYDRELSLEGPAVPWEERAERIAEATLNFKFDHIQQEFPRAIADSLEGVDRVLQIVRAMREFSHPGAVGMTPTDLNRCLQSTATVTRNHWKDAGELTLDLATDLPEVECDAPLMNQVFVNLIVNAADAVIERRDRDPEAPEGLISVRSCWGSENAVFEVEDNGCGMPPGVIRRAFDPFFTTKEVGKGTGQGLALCHSIVARRHGGTLSIRSTPGVGTVMRVQIPLKSARPATPNDPIPHDPTSAVAASAV